VLKVVEKVFTNEAALTIDIFLVMLFFIFMIAVEGKFIIYKYISTVCISAVVIGTLS
jgi:hypothetical protein